MDIQYKRGDHISHSQYGNGEILLDNGETAVVRFEHGIEECSKSNLFPLQSLKEAIAAANWHEPLEVIARTQALAIRSVNDMWGVFSLARITLLPHQLWVCRKVVQELPTRWLIADDVGLGKTIEAGLILWTLLNKNAVKRILILCPAGLVEQWQERLRKMFDIRMTRYTTEADTPKSDFWNTHSQVIASLPTLRKNSNNRHLCVTLSLICVLAKLFNGNLRQPETLWLCAKIREEVVKVIMEFQRMNTNLTSLQ